MPSQCEARSTGPPYRVMSLCAAEQDLDERPERPSPMRDPMLGGGGRFAKAHLQIGRKKQRIVAEAAGTARLLQDEAVTRGLDDLRHAARRREEGDHAAVAGTALRRSEERRVG